MTDSDPRVDSGAAVVSAAPGSRGRAKVEADAVRVSFRHPQTQRQQLVLDDVSLEVPEGQFLSIVGPSGCGKTTLLNVLAGFIQPDAGEARFDGVPVDGIQASRMAYMFAKDTLLPWRTALANVEFALEIGGRQPDRDRARELLDMVGLIESADYFPSQLSHGMRQRVALARTLAADRDVLLMDEPFGALDAQTKTVMEDEFSRIWETQRKTVVFVTHDLMEAIALSDRVVVMSGSPARFVADHIIELPRPRVVIDLQANPDFHAIFRRLWEDLKTGIQEGPDS